VAADWSALTRYLKGRSDDRVTLAWSELAGIVGEVPGSAIDHAAWWSGDRAHTRAWKAAGFEVETKAPGRSVTFRRVTGSEMRPTGAPTSEEVVPDSEAPDLLLVTCVKSKRREPARAKDLYTSPFFVRERAYAEQLGVPWYILSAEWGLVRPDDWLSPYERYLPDTPPTYRAAWGAWVVERLALEAGDLRGKLIEVHAADAYVRAVEQGLRARGAVLALPLSGLSLGERLAWYDRRSSPPPAGPSSTAEPTEVSDRSTEFVALLQDAAGAMSPAEFLAADRAAYGAPGLYSWWVDESGAADLSAGLELEITPGLIYAGLAGATRWPSGKRSTNTLWLRIAGMHLGGRHDFSTFRRTLGAVLAEAFGWQRIEEDDLTAWMHQHLRVLAQPYPDGDTLGRLEASVLAELDPPLNLKDVPPTPVRRRLRELRRKYRDL
jgi:hypothetical protein